MSNKIIYKILLSLISSVLFLSFYGCSSPSNVESAHPIILNNGELDNILGDNTQGYSFVLPKEILLSPFDENGAISENDATIGVGSADEGYISAFARSRTRLKIQVENNGMIYNYDLPSTDQEVALPMNMGNGNYNISVLINTIGNSYLEILSTTQDVILDNTFLPFMRPNIYCNYNADSEVVIKARELVADAKNEGDVFRIIYNWICDNITYDTDKANQLENNSGYIPNPDETLESLTGICFDYASIAGAMFRSLGIPCKIVKGYKGDILHAWNEVFIDGKWVSAAFTVNDDQWTRIDLTFAAADDNYSAIDATDYTELYVY